MKFYLLCAVLFCLPVIGMAMDGNEPGSGAGECIYLNIDPLYCKRIQPTRGEAHCLAAGYRPRFCKGMAEGEGLCLQLRLFRNPKACKDISVNMVYCLAGLGNHSFCSSLEQNRVKGR